MSATADSYGGLNGKLLDKIALWGEAVGRGSRWWSMTLQPHSLQRGYQAANVDLFNFMSVPLLIDGSVVAVAGLGNRPGHYNDNDVYEITLLMSGVWHALERRNAQEKLIYERNKYLQVLLSIDEGNDGGQGRQGRNAQCGGAKADRLDIGEALHKHYKSVYSSP